METFSALLALCAGNSLVTGEFPAERPVTGSFEVFFHLCLNKRLSKQWWGWWFETPSCPLWRHCNAQCLIYCSPGISRYSYLHNGDTSTAERKSQCFNGPVIVALISDDVCMCVCGKCAQLIWRKINVCLHPGFTCMMHVWIDKHKDVKMINFLGRACSHSAGVFTGTEGQLVGLCAEICQEILVRPERPNKN